MGRHLWFMTEVIFMMERLNIVKNSNSSQNEQYMNLAGINQKITNWFQNSHEYAKDLEGNKNI